MHHATPTIETSIREVQGVGLGLGDRIEALDFAVDAAGSLHVVWSASLGGGGGALPDYRTFYASGRWDGDAWSLPVPLTDGFTRSVRVWLAGTRLRVLSGRQMRYFESLDRGKTWHDLESLLPAGWSADSFDVLESGGRQFSVFEVLRRPGRLPDGKPRKELYSLALGNEGRRDPRPVFTAEPTPFDSPPPRLVGKGELVDLAFVVNHLVDRKARTDEAGETVSSLFHLRSLDGGASWSAPTRAWSPRHAIQTANAVDIAHVGEDLLALVSAHGIYALNFTSGSWSPPVRINRYKTRVSRGSEDSSGVSVAAADGRGWVAWADGRFTRSNLRWWNPTGGFPWSDDNPLWSNSDLFALSVSAVLEMARGGSAAPNRITPDLSRVERVRTRVVEGRTYLLWSGRAQVGKRLEDADKPPALFFALVEDEGRESLR